MHGPAGFDRHTGPVSLPGPAAYGDAFADVYDDWYSELGDVEAVLDVLDGLAGPDTRPGRVLELGAGTGRLAVPLGARGHLVVAVDASLAMLGRLAAKLRDGRVVPVAADMAVLPLAGGFDLVFVAFNTLFNLADTAAQRACLAEVARVLGPGGRLVLEAFVPPDRLDERAAALRGATGETAAGGPTIEVRHDDEDGVVFSASRLDGAAQVVTGHHVELTVSGARFRSWRVHYQSVAQLDALVTGAGLELDQRWADWHGTRFDEASDTHVSVYRRGGTGA